MLSSMFNAAILDKTAKVLVQQRQRASSPTILRFFAHWGGIGLVPLAILDSSPIPTFGSLDILTAFLSARHSDLWLYYACMATFGAMIGSYFTYKLGQKTGLAWIEKNFGARCSQQVEYALERWGSGAIFVSTVSPPPCPTSMFLLAAGAFGYRMRKFFLAVFLGRAIRYGLLTIIAAHYGRRIVRYMRHPGQYLWLSLGVTILIIAITAAFLILRRPSRVPEERLPHAS